MAATPTSRRLPRDVREASWTWSYELPHRHGVVTGPTCTTLTCRVVLADTDDCTGLVLKASGSDGTQQESFSFRRRAPVVHPPGYDGNVAIQTSCGLLRGRIVGYNRDGLVDVYAYPGSVVAFVKALEMYVRDEVWF